MGLMLQQRLAGLAAAHPGVIAEMRGEGLMLGLTLRVPNTDFAAAARAEHILVIPAGDNVVRLLPPLIVTEDEIARGRSTRLDAACARFEAQRAAAPERGCGMSRSNRRRSGRRAAFSRSSRNSGRRSAPHSRRCRPRSRPAGARAARAADQPLAGKVLAMIFDKPSTRTRVSFDVGMRELGGETMMLTGTEMQLGRGETIADTARVLSRFVDAIMIRILDHDDLMELARLRRPCRSSTA